MEIKSMTLVTYEKFGITQQALFTSNYEAEAFARMVDGNVNFIPWDVTVDLPKQVPA